MCNAVQIPTLFLIRRKNLQLLRPIRSLSHYGPFGTTTQSFNSAQRRTLTMKKSINITEKGLWFVHIGLFQSGISQILEGRIWVSPHSLLLVLVAAPMLPMPLYQRRLTFNWTALQHTSWKVKLETN